MKSSTLTSLVLCICLALSASQYNDDGYEDYPDYQDQGLYGDMEPEDNLYHNYAARQQEKEIGGGGGGMGRLIMGSAISWFLGAKFHSGRTARKIKAKFQKEQKQLYSQYYNDVYKLTEQNTELQFMVEQLQEALQQTEQRHELEALQRDYEEFKQPDIDGDDQISRAEFNMYIKNYLANYPGLTEKDYPRFEDFDHDGDGKISFQEYANQMALQAQQAELEQLYGGGNNAATKSQGLNDLYKDAKSAGGFQDMYGR